MSWRRGGAQLREARRSVAQTSGARTRRLPKGSPDSQGSSGIRTAIRNFKFGGNMVKASRSFGALPFSVATSTNSKLRASVAITIFISSIARYRPGHKRGPAPNGIDAFNRPRADAAMSIWSVAVGLLAASRQRAGRNSAASAARVRSTAPGRITHITSVSGGSRATSHRRALAAAIHPGKHGPWSLEMLESVEVAQERMRPIRFG